MYILHVYIKYVLHIIYIHLQLACLFIGIDNMITVHAYTISNIGTVHKAITIEYKYYI